jgi:hypothetical protein
MPNIEVDLNVREHLPKLVTHVAAVVDDHCFWVRYSEFIAAAP